jgi:hypothetical protein
MQIENTFQSKISTILFLAMRQMSTTLITALFFISVTLITWGTYVAGAEAAAMKWHPGHYVILLGKGKDSSYYMQNIYQELTETPALRGVTIRYNWAELEPKKGVYNFKSIDRHLAELTERKKRLVILLEMKTFSPTSALVPAYLKAPEYDGGVFAYRGLKSTGNMIKLWDPQVRDRLAALVRALGNRYNSKPYFEGFGTTETAMGPAVNPLTNAQVDKYYDNLLDINRVARRSFPNTMTFQYTNYPRDILPSFVSQLKSMGATLACPDVFLQDPGLLFKGTEHSPAGIYAHYSKNSNLMPLAVQIEHGNFVDTRADGTGYKPSVSQLFAFARDKLKVNYIFWVRIPEYFDNVQQLLRQNAQSRNVAGGLNATCPKSYASCTN